LKTSQGAACYRIGRNSPISGAEIGGENFGAATGKDRAARARSRGGRAAASRMPPIRQPPIVGADLSNLKISPAVRTLLSQGSFGTSKAAGIEAEWRRRSAVGGPRLSRNPMPRNVRSRAASRPQRRGQSCERGTMRFIMKISWDVEAGNALARKGTLASTVQSILADVKPEAAYFMAEDGKRGGILVVDITDASQIPALAEPWFLAANAKVEFLPAMRPEDLAKAGPSIEAAVKKYGGSR